MEAQQLIDKLGLLPHPEGGYFKETYRSTEDIAANALPDRFTAERQFSTAIYFLLLDDNFSALHRIKSDEVWHFYTGSPIVVTEINSEGSLTQTTLGSNVEQGQVFQHTVPAGSWFGSEVLGRSGYALVGCTVAPGFDMQDFEMADGQELIQQFPQHSTVINTLIR